jgi:glucose/arabinose dehydrogenase
MLATVVAGSVWAAPAPNPPDAYGETRNRQAPRYTPASPEQFRAPKPAQKQEVEVAVLSKTLTWPWAIEPLADGSFLVTEKFGTLRHVLADGKVEPPMTGVPPINPNDASLTQGGGGLLDVALAPDFAKSRRLYFTYSTTEPGGPNGSQSRLAVATALLAPDMKAVTGWKTIWKMDKVSPSHEHYGGRIAFDRTGAMFVSTGERAPDHGEFGVQAYKDARLFAQDPNTDVGKIDRIKTDGSAPADNPFVKGGGAKDVWSLGHRNVLAITVDPKTGLVWTAEHGPTGGDELNQPQPGKNYGWPIITYGLDHDRGPVGEGITQKPGLEQPIYYWDPNVAPGGMLFYTGDKFPEWKGDLLISGMIDKRLHRLKLDGRKVVAEDWVQLDARLRDVAQGPDGSLYLITDELFGKLIKLSPRGGR